MTDSDILENGGKTGKSVLFRGAYLLGLAGILLMIVLGVYANSFHGPFIFDDFNGIVSNSRIQRLDSPWDWFRPQPELTLAGRPVSSLSFAMNYHFSGLKVEAYHWTNMGIHALNALLFYALLLKVFQMNFLSGFVVGLKTEFAFSAALLWAVHPLLTESVDYVLQRTELLMGFFFLLSFYCGVQGIHAQRKAGGWYFASVVFALLSMGSKEVGGMILFVILAYDWMVCGVGIREILKKRRWFYLGQVSCWIALFFLIQNGQLQTGVSGSRGGMPAWLYLKTQSTAIFHYLKLSVWPSPLVLDYDDWPRADHLVSVVPEMLGMLILVLGSFWFLRRRSWIGFCGSCFFLILAPSSSLIPIATEVVAERRMYLPLMLLVLLMMGGGLMLVRWIGKSTWVRSVIFGVLYTFIFLFFAGLTVKRNQDYRSELSIWSDTVSKRPRNARAWVWLGFSHAKMGDLISAIQSLKKALDLDSDNEYAHHGLGDILVAQGKTSEALQHFKEVIRIRPGFSAVYLKIGRLCLELGEVKEAIPYLKKAVELNPKDSTSRELLDKAAMIQLQRALSR